MKQRRETSMFKSLERNCCVECNANGIGLVIYSQGQRQYKVISLYLLGIKKIQNHVLVGS